jgi:hypothetical protein
MAHAVSRIMYLASAPKEPVVGIVAKNPGGGAAHFCHVFKLSGRSRVKELLSKVNMAFDLAANIEEEKAAEAEVGEKGASAAADAAEAERTGDVPTAEVGEEEEDQGIDNEGTVDQRMIERVIEGLQLLELVEEESDESVVDDDEHTPLWQRASECGRGAEVEAGCEAEASLTTDSTCDVPTDLDLGGYGMGVGDAAFAAGAAVEKKVEGGEGEEEKDEEEKGGGGEEEEEQDDALPPNPTIETEEHADALDLIQPSANSVLLPAKAAPAAPSADVATKTELASEAAASSLSAPPKSAVSG